jgi:biopolymer transport protein ExbD
MKQKNLTIAVRSDGSIVFNGKPLQANDSITIQKQLEAEQKQLGTKDVYVQLEADPSSEQKHVVSVLDAAAGAGVSHLTFLPGKD